MDICRNEGQIDAGAVRSDDDNLLEPDYLERAVDTLALVLQKPDFPAEALERERKLMLTALKQREQEPDTRAGERRVPQGFR